MIVLDTTIHSYVVAFWWAAAIFAASTCDAARRRT
jgi:hypothetical protein